MKRLITGLVATLILAAVAAEEPRPLPAFPRQAGKKAWINSDPLTVEELRGKVVLIKVWTFG